MSLQEKIIKELGVKPTIDAQEEILNQWTSSKII